MDHPSLKLNPCEEASLFQDEMDVTKRKICFKYKKETWVSVHVKAIRWKIDWWGTRHSRGAKESPHISHAVTREKMFLHNRDTYHDPHSLIKLHSVTRGRRGAVPRGSQPHPGKIPAANGHQALQCDFRLIARGRTRTGRIRQIQHGGNLYRTTGPKVNPRLFSIKRDSRDMEWSGSWLDPDLKNSYKRHLMTTGENEYGPGNRWC